MREIHWKIETCNWINVCRVQTNVGNGLCALFYVSSCQIIVRLRHTDGAGPAFCAEHIVLAIHRQRNCISFYNSIVSHMHTSYRNLNYTHLHT